ncbi:anti-sigma factor family protein [Pseudomonas extremorientalis]|uniref:anti-sigma factor family protein n=1 Tax=Pseudomonas extremorientalis TaxID=169669 RepID=UPI00211CB910|nr:zf-HC2 domain-containing protein [Pseudomonas extremorientalis]UUN87333.1 zf-HC2 domain-containing protein [Pseudomonas extremorientalis]
MLTCKEQVARSSDYLDGQLTFRERLLVRHHLMFCPNCRRFIRQMRLMQATLRIMPDEPVGGVEALAQRLADERLKDHKGGE